MVVKMTFTTAVTTGTILSTAGGQCAVLLKHSLLF